MPGTQLGKETAAINLLQPMRTPDRPRLLADPLRPSTASGAVGRPGPSSSRPRAASARPRRRMDSSPHVPWSDRAPAPILTLPVLPEVYKRMYLGLPSHEYGKRASLTRHDQPVKSDEWVELERQVSEVRSQGSRALVNREWSSASAFLIEALQLEGKLDVVSGLVKPAAAAPPTPTKPCRARHAGVQTSLVFGSGIAAPEIWPDSSVRLHFEAAAATADEDAEAAAAPPATVDAGTDAASSSPMPPLTRSVACWTAQADHMHLEEGHQLTISLEHCVAKRDGGGGKGARMSLRGSTEKYASSRDALLEQARARRMPPRHACACTHAPAGAAWAPACAAAHATPTPRHAHRTLHRSCARGAARRASCTCRSASPLRTCRRSSAATSTRRRCRACSARYVPRAGRRSLDPTPRLAEQQPQQPTADPLRLHATRHHATRHSRVARAPVPAACRHAQPLHRLQLDPYDGVTGGAPPRLGAFEVGYTLTTLSADGAAHAAHAAPAHADGASEPLYLGGERVFSKLARGCFPRAERVVLRLLRHVQVRSPRATRHAPRATRHAPRAPSATRHAPRATRHAPRATRHAPRATAPPRHRATRHRATRHAMLRSRAPLRC